MSTTLQSFDSGSNYNFGDKMMAPNCPRSGFDLSHLVTTTIDNGGIVYPIEIIPVNPNEDYEFSVRSLLRVLPQVVPLYSRQRLYIYAMYNRMGDLWNHWNTFMSKGYSGKTSITRVPTINSSNTDSSLNSAKVAPMSLGDCLGLPIGKTQTNFLDKISALPFMMYLRVYRDYFANKNYFIDDRVLLPDDDSRFRLDDDGQLLSAKDLGFAFHFDFTSATPKDYTAPVSGSPSTPGLFGLFYHDWPDDYFTSALPFPQRGDEASITVDTSAFAAHLDLSGAKVGLGTAYSQLSPQVLYGSDSSGSYVTSGQNAFVRLNVNTSDTDRPLTYENGEIGTPGGRSAQVQVYRSGAQGPTNVFPVEFDSGSFTLTLDALRRLDIDQREMERLARTDGSYSQFGLTFFGEKPKNSNDFRPTYIGGTFVSLSFSEVLQTSAQYQVSDDVVSPLGSPVGTYAGHGIGVDSNGYIGRLHTDDYGYVMFLISIMPDVYYSQGLDLHWSNLAQTDFLLPERAKLGMKPIYNRELYFSGTASQDDDLWAYQNIYDELRYMPNKIHGKIADKTSEDFAPYTQARFFDSLPNYGKSFAEAQAVRKDYLASYEEVAYTAQFAFDIRAVRPLPYKPVPSDILN